MSHTCQFCKKVFATGQEYAVHMHDLHQYDCSLCYTECPDKVGRVQHQRQHHNRHPCDICWNYFDTEDELAVHYANPNTDPSRCWVCGEEVGPGVLFWEHCHQLHPYQCPLKGHYECIVRYDGKVDLDAHLVYWHHVFPCQHCHLVYRTEQHRVDHVIAARHIPCTLCRKVFTFADGRDLHTIHAHRGVRCSVCQQVFSSEVEFQHHYNDVHRFTCSHCPMSFPNAQARDAHYNTAHRVQCVLCGEHVAREMVDVHVQSVHRFPCIICDKVLDSEEDRDRHASVVHQVQCEVCGLRLDSVAIKHVHYNAVHRPSCDLCSKVYVTVQELQLHYNTMHDKVYSERGHIEDTAAAEIKCTACGYNEVFPTEEALVNHYTNAHITEYEKNFHFKDNAA